MSLPQELSSTELPSSRWLRALGRVGVDLRPEETGLVGGLFLASFVLGVFQFSSKAVRQASYIDQFGADRLPYVYLAVALSAYPVLRLYGLVAKRWSPLAVISATLGIIVAGLLGFWWMMATPSTWVPVAYYVWVAIATALALTQLWSLANTYLHARQARRLFGLIGAGSLLGGVVGGQVASLFRDQPRHTLLVAAVMLLVMIYLVYRLQQTGERGRSLTGEILLQDSEELKLTAQEKRPRGLELLNSSHHLRLIAGILIITVIVAQIIDLQFSWVIENARDSYSGRVSAFGNVFSLMGLSAFIFQLVLTPRIHRSFGVGHAMRVLPGFVAFGCIALLLASSLAPVLLVFVVGMLRIGDNGLRYSLDHVTRELLFVPVPAAQRVEAKGYVDVFVHRFGKALGAVLLLSVTFGWVSVLQMTWVTLGLVVAWMLLTVRAKRHYVEALRQGLSEGADWPRGGGSPPDLALDLNDVNTLEILVEALGSADPTKVVGSLKLLHSHDRAKLVPPLLLYHDDPEVRNVTLEALMVAGRRDALPLIERCVGDNDADVRATAVRALAKLSSQRGPELMVTRLSDADPRIRAAAIQCVLLQGSDEQAARGQTALEKMLCDGSPKVRVEAAKVLGSLPDPQLQQRVVALFFDSSKEVVRAMIVALRQRVKKRNPSPIYVPILVSLLRDRRLKHDARKTLVTYGRGILPALSHFLNDPNEHIWVRRAIPKTLVHFGSRGAAPVLYESLGSCEDPMQLSKVIEALSSLTNHRRDDVRLGRCLAKVTRRYFEIVLALDGLSNGTIRLKGTTLVWVDSAGEPLNDAHRHSLVVRLLDENRQSLLSNITALIGLLVPGVILGQLFTQRTGDDDGAGEQRRRALSHAVEYLDNVLQGRLRDEVLLVLDDLPTGRRLARARELFGFPHRDAEQTLAWLLTRAEGHEVERWLAAAAAHRIGERKIEALYPMVCDLADGPDGTLVRETAQVVLQRMIA